uniref:HD2 homeodomain mating-type protein Le.a2-2 n=1 Tax=Lentinula edodes TaxID=5353 RepID=G9FIM1_LENED|nr:HD2 homeodomain mating-type protein Le.a2-2 [Lentinula edodes]
MDVKNLEELRRRVAVSRRILEDAHRQRFGPLVNSPPSDIETSPASPLQLVVPQAFRAEIQKHHISAGARESLQRTLDEMVDSYSQQFDEAWHKLAQTTGPPRLQSLLPRIVEQLRCGIQHHFEMYGLPKIIEAVKEHAEKHPRPSTPPPPTRQSSIPAYEAPVPFNNEYTPILETYFQYDPYPTSRDRQIIAERSGMTRRQIEVWFQNHRRTARQSGITLPAKRPPGAIAPPGLDVPFAVGQGQGGQGQGQEQGEGDGEGQRQDESSGEKKRRKARMLDMFNINSKGSSSSISPGSGSGSGSGQGMTPDDPIQIDGVPSSMTTTSMMMMISENCDDESRMGMTLTNAGNGISILEPIDVVERMVREKERKAVEEEMREERKKYLSVIAPASFNHNNNHDNLPISTTTNPLDSPSSSRDTLFPAPFTRPPAHLQFRYRVAPAAASSSSSSSSSSSTDTHTPPPPPTHAAFPPSNDTNPPITGTVRPILPPPTWTRLAPPTSYQVPPPPTSTSTTPLPSTHPSTHPSTKSKKKSKSKEKRPTKEELRLLDESKRLLEIDEAIMMKRLWFCSFDDRVESGTIRAQGGVSTYESIAGGVVEREKNALTSTTSSNPIKPKSSVSTATSTSKAKSILQKLGVGLDAATCAYTYVLPKAPFWALVRDGGRGERGEGSFSTSSSSSLSSSFSSGSDSSASFDLSSSRDSSSSFNSLMSSDSPSSPPTPPPATPHEFPLSVCLSVSSSHKPTRKGFKKPAALGPKRRPRNAPSGVQAANVANGVNGVNAINGVSGVNVANGMGFTQFAGVERALNTKEKGKGKAKAISFDRYESTSFPSSSSSSASHSSSSSTSSSSSSSLIPPPNPPIIPQGFPDGFTPFSNNAMSGYYDFGFGGREQQGQVQGQGQQQRQQGQQQQQQGQQQQQQGQQQQQQGQQQQPSAPAAQSEPKSLLSESQPQRDQIGFTYAFGNPYPTTNTSTSSSSIPSSSSTSSSNSIPTTTSSSSSTTSSSVDSTLATAHNEIDVQSIDMNMLNAFLSGDLGGARVGGGGSVGGVGSGIGNGVGSGVGSGIGNGVGNAVGSVGSGVGSVGSVGSAGTNPYLNPMTMNMGSLASGSIGSSGMAAIAAFGGMAAMNAGMNMGMGIGMGMGSMGMGGIGGMGGMGGWSSS